MHKTRINWWGFLLLAGLVIPLAQYLSTDNFFIGGVFSPYFVVGLNPILALAGYFILLLTLCLLIKLANVVRSRSLALVLYIILGLMILSVFVPLPHSYYYPKDDAFRRSITFSTKEDFGSAVNPLIWQWVTTGIFLLVYTINFPRSYSKQKKRALH